MKNKKYFTSFWFSNTQIFCRVGLAQLEESEGNLDVARKIYVEAVSIYERKRGIAKVGTSPNKYVKHAKLGDKWTNVYKSTQNFGPFVPAGTNEGANSTFSKCSTQPDARGSTIQDGFI